MTIARKPYSHYRTTDVVIDDAPHLIASVDVFHPRRQYPLVRVFIDAILVYSDEVWHEDARAVAQALDLDELRRAAFPRELARQLVQEATRALYLARQ